MKTYILIYNKAIIGVIKTESRVMARHKCCQKLQAIGQDLDFNKIQAIEFIDDQLLLI